MEVCGCENPKDIGGHEAIVIGCVDVVGEGGVESWKNSFLLGFEVGTKNVTSGLVVISSET